jgi:hypothetical protein
MQKIPLGTPKVHKIPWGISKMYTIPRGTLKYTQCHEKLPKMPKITGETSKYAQNPTRIFRKCTKSQGNIASFVSYCLCTQRNTASFVCYCIYPQGNIASFFLLFPIHPG